MIDVIVLKKAIYSLVQVGYKQTLIRGEGGIYDWTADDNDSSIYYHEFLEILIETTKQYF
jgi:hypothetical protein